jgi:Zn-dependent protease
MPIPVEADGLFLQFGDSLLFKGMVTAILGTVPADKDVFLHPVAFAGWIGFFVTSLNLIPIGQLDGGHILYALTGEKHAAISKVLIALLFIMGLWLWEGWVIWGVLLIIFGSKHPPIVILQCRSPRKKDHPGEKLSLAIFVLTFIPVPVMIK